MDALVGGIYVPELYASLEISKTPENALELRTGKLSDPLDLMFFYDEDGSGKAFLWRPEFSPDAIQVSRGMDGKFVVDLGILFTQQSCKNWLLVFLPGTKFFRFTFFSLGS